MLNKFAKILLTLTALEPVVLTYALIAAINKQYNVTIICIALCCLILAFCDYIIRLCSHNLVEDSIHIESIEPYDQENLSFYLIYTLPILTTKFTELDWRVWAIIFLFYISIIYKGFNYSSNPLLLFIGWHFYKAQSSNGVTYILLTRKTLLKAKQQFKVIRVTEYLLLEKNPK